jgi:hypothetical protein
MTNIMKLIHGEHDYGYIEYLRALTVDDFDFDPEKTTKVSDEEEFNYRRTVSVWCRAKFKPDVKKHLIKFVAQRDDWRFRDSIEQCYGPCASRDFDYRGCRNEEHRLRRREKALQTLIEDRQHLYIKGWIDEWNERFTHYINRRNEDYAGDLVRKWSTLEGWKLDVLDDEAGNGALLSEISTLNEKLNCLRDELRERRAAEIIKYTRKQADELPPGVADKIIKNLEEGSLIQSGLFSH